MRRRAAILVVLPLLLAACARGTEPAGRTSDGPTLHEDRLALPEYDLERFRDLLATLEGTPVLVNIWASWCVPCRVEAPHLAGLARDYEGEVQFLGVDILDTREAARDFILEFDWPYPSVFDPDGEIRDGLGYLGQPVTFLVDARGETVFEWSGAVTEDLLREELERVTA